MANNSSRIQTGLGVPNTISLTGTGTPLGNVSASVGAIYTNLADGSLWTKTSGTNTTTGWVAGASAPTVVSISASAAASSWNQIILVDCTSGNITVTLPTAVLNSGKTIEVKKIDSTTNAVIVDGNSAETIDGQLTQTIQGQFNCARFISNGTNVIMEDLTQGIVGEYVAPQYPVTGSVATTGITAATAIDYMSITLPSAGVWEIAWAVRARAQGGIGVASVLTDNSNVVQANSEVETGYTITAAADVQTTGRGQYIVTTTGATTYKVRIYGVSNAGQSALSDGNGRSFVTAKKISGYIPVSGQLVDYSGVEQHSVGTATNLTTVTSTNATTSGTLLPTGNRVVLTGATVSGNLTVNAANGTIAIAKNGTYNVVVTVNTQTAGANAQWGQLAKNNATVIAASSAYAQLGGTAMQITFAYTGDFVIGDLIDVRLSANSAGTIGITGYSYSVVQVGSSAFTTLNAFTGATSLLPGTAGGVPAPIALDNSKLLVGDGTWGTSLIGKRTLTSGTSYIPTSGTNKIVAYVVGGGAGSGLCAAAANTTQGGGGGAGGIVGFVEDVSDQVTYTYSIGSGGASSTSGTATTITVNGNTYTGNGGTAGTDGSGSAPLVTAGGNGGTTSPLVVTGNAFMVTRGQPGGMGYALASNNHGSGIGGSGMFGGGGNGQTLNAGGSAAGIAATGFGAGGGGAIQNNNTSRAGGAGSDGMIVIFEYR